MATTSLTPLQQTAMIRATDYWNDSCSIQELTYAIANGAVGATSNPTIVLADADFPSAVENVVNAAFFSTGQKCTATSRAIVEDAIYDRFVAAVVERAGKLKVGDGMQPGTEIGRCVDQAQMETVLRYIEIGRKECGEPRCSWPSTWSPSRLMRWSPCRWDSSAT